MKSYFEQYDEVFEMQFSVPFEFPVFFGRNLLDPENPLLMKVMDRKNENRRHRAIVYVDSGTARAYPNLEKDLKHYFSSWEKHIELVAPPVCIEPTDKMDNGWTTVHSITDAINEHHLCRQSFVIAIGGGALIDTVGLATSLAHRGLRLIRMPTTVLGQNDAGIGVKNAIDAYGAKNFIGTFAPPFAVLNDYALLDRLPDTAWVGGVAEAFKVAIIKDRNFLDFLCKNAERFKERVPIAMEKLIHQCAILHLDHIQSNGDPFEMGSARPLDFGHWSAHKLETMSNYTIAHGQAVAIGVALDSLYASRCDMISEDDAEMIITGLLKSGLPVWHKLLSREKADGDLEVFDGLRSFREHLGGVLTLTLPKGLGSRIEVNEVDESIMRECVAKLEHWQRDHQSSVAI